MARPMPQSATFTRPDGRDEDVARLDVAVQHAGGVGVAEGGGDVGGDVDGALGRQRRRRSRMMSARLRPVDVLHDDEVRAVLLAPVEHRDDVRVVQVGGGLRLAAEAGDEGGVVGELGEQHLDRHRPVELEVAGEEHLGHAAPPESAVQLVAAVEDGGFGHVGSERRCG